MLAVIHFRVPEAGAADFRRAAGDTLQALAARDGHVRSRFGRAADDPQAWVLVTEWTGMGPYRRALSAAAPRVALAGLFGWSAPDPAAGAGDAPSAFEVLLDAGPGGATGQDSDRAGPGPRG